MNEVDGEKKKKRKTKKVSAPATVRLGSHQALGMEGGLDWLVMSTSHDSNLVSPHAYIDAVRQLVGQRKAGLQGAAASSLSAVDMKCSIQSSESQIASFPTPSTPWE